jgi:polar amino acid transport system substrate-binding protein
MTKRLFSLLLIILILIPLWAYSDLKIYTEDFPPYNFMEKSQIKGITTEIVRRIIQKGGFKAEIKMTSWGRCIKYLNHSKTPVAVFTMAMNEKRKNLYKWVGPIRRINISVYTLEGRDFKIRNLDDIKQHIMIVGISKNSNTHDYLTGINFPKELIDPTFGFGTIVKKLYYGRVSAVILEDQTFSSNARKLNMDMDSFKNHFKLQTRSTWIAFSKNTPDKTVERWQQAFDGIPKKEIEKIFKRYGLKE